MSELGWKVYGYRGWIIKVNESGLHARYYDSNMEQNQSHLVNTGGDNDLLEIAKKEIDRLLDEAVNP